MTVLKHELKQNRKALIVWTVAIAFLLATCIFLFPEMKGEMDSVSEVFSSMGGFSEAFGMDKVSFGTLTGFYSVECGNILGLGGAFFAAFTAVTILAKEEKDHTGEFLLTHPVSRCGVVTGKLIAVLVQIAVVNIIIYLVAIGSIALVGEEIPWKEITLLHTAYFLMQLELGGICFGVSAFLRKGSLGIGLGIAILMYFLNIITNISDSTEFLKYITPFAYAEGSEIVSNLSLDCPLIVLGIGYGVFGIILGYLKYAKKDIA
ncbi:MAG: ABC transporter permease subunit [Ruminococcus sp.]